MPLGRGFRRLWAGNAASNLSDGIVFVAIPLMATAITTDPTVIAGLAVAYSAVRLLVVVPVGVYVDRLDRRTILFGVTLFRAALLLALGGAFATGYGTVPVLYAAFIAIGVVETAADNAALSLLPTIVPRDDLDRANGHVSTAQLVADEFAGPPLGGVLFGLAAALPVAVAGALNVVAGLIFLALPREQSQATPPPESRTSVYRDAAQGAAWLVRHRLLGGIALIGGIASIGYMMPFSVLVLFASERLHLDAFGYGLVLSVSAVGGLIGSFVAARLRTRLGYGWTIALSLAIAATTMIALGLSQSAWSAAVLLAAYIFHSVVWGICVSSLRGRLVPDELRGRVNASSKVASLIGLATGAALGGVLAASVSIVAPFFASGALFVGATLFAVALFRVERTSPELLGTAATPG